jgi:hypothetical protein
MAMDLKCKSYYSGRSPQLMLPFGQYDQMDAFGPSIKKHYMTKKSAYCYHFFNVISFFLSGMIR